MFSICTCSSLIFFSLNLNESIFSLKSIIRLLIVALVVLSTSDWIFFATFFASNMLITHAVEYFDVPSIKSRNDRIWTCDPHNPIVVRYRAAPRSENDYFEIIERILLNSSFILESIILCLSEFSCELISVLPSESLPFKQFLAPSIVYFLS